jgi:hypothetical protein
LALLVAVSLVLRHTASVGRVPSTAVLAVASPLLGSARRCSYLALPRHVECLEATPIEGNQQVGAAVSVLHGELRIAHLLAGRPCCPLAGPVPMEGWGARETYAAVSLRILTPLWAAIGRLRRQLRGRC